MWVDDRVGWVSMWNGFDDEGEVTGPDRFGSLSYHGSGPCSQHENGPESQPQVSKDVSEPSARKSTAHGLFPKKK